VPSGRREHDRDQIALGEDFRGLVSRVRKRRGPWPEPICDRAVPSQIIPSIAVIEEIFGNETVQGLLRKIVLGENFVLELQEEFLVCFGV
jgi:hypothetical protein